MDSIPELRLPVMQEVDRGQIEVLLVPGEGSPPASEVEVRGVDSADLGVS